MKYAGDIIQLFESLMKATGDERTATIRESRDFWEEPADDDELNSLYGEFGKQLDSEVEVLSRTWGAPAFHGNSESENYPIWGESMQLACWELGDEIAFIRVVHMDREFPVSLEAGVLTKDEAARLEKEITGWEDDIEDDEEQ